MISISYGTKVVETENNSRNILVNWRGKKEDKNTTLLLKIVSKVE